jgi:hypothetical protein
LESWEKCGDSYDSWRFDHIFLHQTPDCTSPHHGSQQGALPKVESKVFSGAMKGTDFLSETNNFTPLMGHQSVFSNLGEVV